jgi:hypothetical protein
MSTPNATAPKRQAERTRIERRLGEIEREIKQVVDAITKGYPNRSSHACAS